MKYVRPLTQRSSAHCTRQSSCHVRARLRCQMGAGNSSASTRAPASSGGTAGLSSSSAERVRRAAAGGVGRRDGGAARTSATCRPFRQTIAAADRRRSRPHPLRHHQLLPASSAQLRFDNGGVEYTVSVDGSVDARHKQKSAPVVVEGAQVGSRVVVLAA